MNNAGETNIPLEILIATMNRNTLDFLDEMFLNVSDLNFQILIVNQTTSDALLISDRSNVRIINSFEKGLSKSRNLAIANAVGDFCLISDDDVVFVEGFQDSILQAYKLYDDAALISFKVLKAEESPYRKYSTGSEAHTLPSIENIMSIEISLNLKFIRDKNLQFDTNFGLGSHFETAEEYIFTREVIDQGLKAYFYNKFIAAHPPFTSGQEVDSDKIIYAKAALQYRLHRHFAYLWIPKYLFFLLRNKYIKLNDLRYKYEIAYSGIKTYKKLTST